MLVFMREGLLGLGHDEVVALSEGVDQILVLVALDGTGRINEAASSFEALACVGENGLLNFSKFFNLFGC